MKLNLLMKCFFGCGLIAIFSNCVYFNLFYNAETAYKLGEQAQAKRLKETPDAPKALPADIAVNYKRAIEKSSAVLEIYPQKKKWHDDALFMIGRSNYALGEAGKAVRCFIELQQSYPQSPFIPQSYVWLAKAYLLDDQVDKAEETLLLAQKNYAALKGNGDVALLLAQIALKRQGKAMALDILEGIKNSISGDEKKLDLTVQMARLYVDLQQYDPAIALLLRAPRKKDLAAAVFEVDYLLVVCYRQKNELKKSSDLIAGMLANKAYGRFIPRILLQKGALLAAKGSVDQALDVYKEVTVRVDTGALAAQAWFEEGVLYQKKKHKFDKALECYTKVVALVKDTLAIKQIAQARVTAIQQLFPVIKNAPVASSVPARDSSKIKDSLTTLALAKDSAKTKDSSLVRAHGAKDSALVRKAAALKALASTGDTMNTKKAVRFKRAELFWRELDESDSALGQLAAIYSDSSIDSQYTPQALYTAAWLKRTKLADTAGSTKLLNEIIARFAFSIPAQKAQADLNRAITIMTRSDSAYRAFAAAESLLYDAADTFASADAFYQVYQTYGDCDCGPKGLYLSAWINDNLLEKNKTAMLQYDTLCSRYPQNEFAARCAMPRLKAARDTLAARGLLKKITGSQPVKEVPKKAAVEPVPVVKSAPGSPAGDSLKTAPVKTAADSQVQTLPAKQPVLKPASDSVRPIRVAPQAESIARKAAPDPLTPQ